MENFEQVKYTIAEENLNEKEFFIRKFSFNKIENFIKVDSNSILPVLGNAQYFSFFIYNMNSNKNFLKQCHCVVILRKKFV